ncbi:hypothetical protein [Candidatus Poriferisodalis sp.]|uniref:hypothetical protein n=1 Tax=Candidatus Poriferisodalis sp. TaxID=3101277 RepID=UPI003B52CF28
MSAGSDHGPSLMRECGMVEPSAVTTPPALPPPKWVLGNTVITASMSEKSTSGSANSTACSPALRVRPERGPVGPV